MELSRSVDAVMMVGSMTEKLELKEGQAMRVDLVYLNSQILNLQDGLLALL